MEQRDTVRLRERFLEQVTELLRRHKLAAELAEERGGGDGRPPRERVEDLVHERRLEALQRELERLHPADVAYILEALPLDERLLVWNLVRAERDGETARGGGLRRGARDSSDMRGRARAATGQLDTDEIADIARIPAESSRLFKSLASREERVRAAMSYDEESVGALMEFDRWKCART